MKKTRLILLGCMLLVASAPFAVKTAAFAQAFTWADSYFRDRPATTPANIAVAEIKPTNNNHTLGFDVSPGSTAVENSDNGFAWIDVMNRSPQEPEGGPSFSARVGTKDDVIEFGSRAWNGAGVRAVHIILDRKVAMRLELDGSGNPLVTVYGTVRAGSFQTIPSLIGAQP